MCSIAPYTIATGRRKRKGNPILRLIVWPRKTVRKRKNAWRKQWRRKKSIKYGSKMMVRDRRTTHRKNRWNIRSNDLQYFHRNTFNVYCYMKCNSPAHVYPPPISYDVKRWTCAHCVCRIHAPTQQHRHCMHRNTRTWRKSCVKQMAFSTCRHFLPYSSFGSLRTHNVQQYTQCSLSIQTRAPCSISVAQS